MSTMTLDGVSEDLRRLGYNGYANAIDAHLREREAAKAGVTMEIIDMARNAYTRIRSLNWECENDDEAWRAALEATSMLSARVPNGPHPSHVTRSSDASSFDEVCERCGATDIAGGGWGKLAEPCPASARVPDGWQWIDGVPTHPWDKEWFIAELNDGSRVVLTALPKEYTYDFKTADETYLARRKIKRWMQFPDSEFVAAPKRGEG